MFPFLTSLSLQKLPCPALSTRGRPWAMPQQPSLPQLHLIISSTPTLYCTGPFPLLCARLPYLTCSGGPVFRSVPFLLYFCCSFPVQLLPSPASPLPTLPHSHWEWCFWVKIWILVSPFYTGKSASSQLHTGCSCMCVALLMYSNAKCDQCLNIRLTEIGKNVDKCPIWQGSFKKNPTSASWSGSPSKSNEFYQLFVYKIESNSVDYLLRYPADKQTVGENITLLAETKCKSWMLVRNVWNLSWVLSCSARTIVPAVL